MECREVRELSDSFLGGELQTETNHAILHHVERCPACRAEIDGRRQLRLALRTAFERSADLRPRPEFIAGLVRIETGTAAPRASRRGGMKWLAIAATLALTTVGGYRFFEARLIAAAVGDHRFCALGLTTDGQEATGITSLPEAVRQYEPGFRVFEEVPADEIPTSGGPARVLNRHSCVYGGRRFAHLILQYRGIPVSVIATRGAAPVSLGAVAGHVSTARADNLTVMSFHASGYSVFVVGALTPSDLSALANAVSGDVVRALAKS
ncbi:MAG TPA: zf-HC2 domain-containing protein [Vicinamibacterales bacterium]|nr:zf-HC2 domain-containing protein [Vicinamibacterales bacterium]